MPGVSFVEILFAAAVALVVVGPKKLPGMLRAMGEWFGKLRRMSSQMRVQTGIDDILREEGIDGVNELRSLLRGEIRAAKHRQHDPYTDIDSPDPTLEYPVEGADAAGALPDDLLEDAEDDSHPAAVQSALPTSTDSSSSSSAAEETAPNT